MCLVTAIRVLNKGMRPQFGPLLATHEFLCFHNHNIKDCDVAAAVIAVVV